MFAMLGRSVARAPLLYIAFWIVLLACTWLAAPSFKDVAEDRGFGFLPPDAPSRLGEELFKQAFPDDPLTSNVVLVVSRPDPQTKNAADLKKFIEDRLEPDLRQIAEEEGGLAPDTPVRESLEPEAEPAPARPTSIISRIRTPNAPGTGALLISPDGDAALVVVDLTTDLLTRRNWPTIQRIEGLIDRLDQEGKIPSGMEILLTGSAVIGRDHVRAQRESARATEFWTVLLVVILLLVIYRAPLLALIPLATVVISVQIALHVLAIMAAHGYAMLFEGIQIYITILAYGAGVDYCLFLTARYKEELDRQGSSGPAISESLHKVGAALTASAATVMGGIGMMTFAKFGKFHEAGVVIPISVFMVLCSTLTFSAALLRLTGLWAFWPWGARLHRDTEKVSWAWDKLGKVLLKRPGMIWLTCVLIMAPFAVVAVLKSRELTYDMISNLPKDAPSVAGTRALQEHFSAGNMGPISILLVNKQVSFPSKEGRNAVAKLTDRLQERQEELGLADLRSLTKPLGITPAAERAFEDSDLPRAALQKGLEREALDHYVTDLGERAKIGTRLELVLHDNPFSLMSIANLAKVEGVVRDSLPAELGSDTQISLVGATASIRDLREVTVHDQQRIEILVLASVFVILIFLLRQALICVYLLLSVLFSYYTAFGVTYALFWALYGEEFAGLDWKVGIFLFTILIAVGEDYNIFLMTRIDEEQRVHGPTAGLIRALARTGPIISSCGVIMAGTFISLMAGSLIEMKQLGFALAFGVLLDTFIVRPILVPAFLLMIPRERLRSSPWLSRRRQQAASVQQTPTS